MTGVQTCALPICFPVTIGRIASGKYTLKQTENYGKWLSIQQTFAHAATVQGQAALMQGRAALTNANANASYLKQLGGYYGSLTSGQNMSNDMQRYYTDFMLGKMPIGKAESILRQTPYKHLLDLNIQQNEWSLNKLMQAPIVTGKQIGRAHV